MGNDDFCLCQIDGLILRNGVCVCPILGCEDCSQDSSSCDDCGEGKEFNNGICQCLEEGFILNEAGTCVECPINGCEECSMSGNTATCDNCGEGKEFTNGQCSCLEEGFILNEAGIC